MFRGLPPTDKLRFVIAQEMRPLYNAPCPPVALQAEDPSSVLLPESHCASGTNAIVNGECVLACARRMEARYAALEIVQNPSLPNARRVSLRGRHWTRSITESASAVQ